MANPIPYVVAASGASGAAPKGSIPIGLYGAPAGSVPNATTTTKGIVNQAAAQANSTATDAAGIVTDFNALLAKLRTAGILA